MDTLYCVCVCVGKQRLLTLSKGMPYFFRMDGDISVILWRRKASQPWELPGKKPAEGESEHRAFYWQPQHHLTTTIVGYIYMYMYICSCYHQPLKAMLCYLFVFLSWATFSKICIHDRVLFNHHKRQIKDFEKVLQASQKQPTFCFVFLLLLVYLMEWGIAVHLLVCFLSKGITGNPNDPSRLDKQFVCFG